ncbi:MAG: transketolase [Deltaproteobacteria bacterium]|nr:transketolase [Deltaproteobacteria bacterium]
MSVVNDLSSLARLVRYYTLISTSEAGSGHPSSSLSATDLMTVLFFKYLQADLDHHKDPNNDRLIFSKGHAAPLFYALYGAAGVIKQEELLRLRRLGSPLEGHPTPQFPYAEAATGSLGQGLSIGVGMALNARLDQLPYRTFVLLGDGEMAEGSVWEAIQLASHYHLDNLVGIIDVNRMGQSGETMCGHDVKTYAERVASFGWHVITVDGHSLPEIDAAFKEALAIRGNPKGGSPKMIVARTLKGKGVSFLEDKEGWHGKALSKADLEKALQSLGPVDTNSVGIVEKPEKIKPKRREKQERGTHPIPLPSYSLGQEIATRKAYGEAITALAVQYPEVVCLDGDTKNSTFAEIFAKKWPDRYWEMFIAEQNMVGVAVGLAGRGKIPFASTFAAFLTRGFDQIRMAAVSRANVKFVGSHVGVSIGEDGASQMGLEDIALFRAIHGSTILYPSDAVATLALVEEAIKKEGIVYLRTNRPATLVLYPAGEKFPIGGSKTIRSSKNDRVTVVAAGVTLNQALTAEQTLAQAGIPVRVIDCYSVKPIDAATLLKAGRETKGIVVVEDHWFEGGLGDAVLNVFAGERNVPILKLAVTKMPISGKPEELVDAAGISAPHIVKAVKKLLM